LNFVFVSSFGFSISDFSKLSASVPTIYTKGALIDAKRPVAVSAYPLLRLAIHLPDRKDGPMEGKRRRTSQSS